MKGRDKVLAGVMLPATRKAYDFWVPRGMSARDAGILIAGIPETRERDRYRASPESALMSKGSGRIIDPRCSMGEAGLVNGSPLVLV